MSALSVFLAAIFLSVCGPRRARKAWERLAKNGNDYVMSPFEEFTGFIRGEIAKQTKVVREANIRIE